MNLRATAAIVAGLLAASAGEAREQAPPESAEEVVARNAEARGGLEAWRKVQTMEWVGRISSPRAQEAAVRFRLEQRRPNMTRLEIEASGQKAVRVFDGVNGWKTRSTGHGRADPEPYSPVELTYARAGHGIDGPLMSLNGRSGSVKLTGVDEIGGRSAFHLTIHRPKGSDEDVWVDTETHLEVRYDRQALGPGGRPRRVSVTYGDYRTVDGLKLPFLVTTGNGPQADRMEIETVLLNVPLEDSAFAMPGRARPRGTSSQARASRTPATSSLSEAAPATPSEGGGRP